MQSPPPERDRSAALSADEAFALLGNETRVDILRALWDAFESGRGGNAVPFSDLFERVDMGDSGNFSYHLEKLTGPFVRRTASGYELKQTGINVVRAVVVGAVIEDPAFGPTTVDETCPRCEAPVEIVYADEFMDMRCTGCDGRSRWGGEAGHLFGALVPPLGVEQHTAGAAFRAAVAYSLHEMSLMCGGNCPHCLGPVRTTIDACADHDPGSGLCPNCDRFNAADAWIVCTTCKRSVPPPVTLVALSQPSVTAFYQDRGIDHRFDDWETVARSFRVEEEVVSTDPLRMRLTVPADDAELTLEVDGDLDVASPTP